MAKRDRKGCAQTNRAEERLKVKRAPVPQMAAGREGDEEVWRRAPKKKWRRRVHEIRPSSCETGRWDTVGGRGQELAMSFFRPALLLLLVSKSLVGAENRLANGVPCRMRHSLTPSRRRYGEPQWSEPPMRVTVEDSKGLPVLFYRPREEYLLRLKSHRAFRGFVVQPRLATRQGFVIGHLTGGYFVRDPSWPAQGVHFAQCPPRMSDSVTNRGWREKHSLLLRWRTDRFVGPVQFLFTLFANESVYWSRWEPLSAFLLPRPKLHGSRTLHVPAQLAPRIANSSEVGDQRDVFGSDFSDSESLQTAAVGLPTLQSPLLKLSNLPSLVRSVKEDVNSIGDPHPNASVTPTGYLIQPPIRQTAWVDEEGNDLIFTPQRLTLPDKTHRTDVRSSPRAGIKTSTVHRHKPISATAHRLKPTATKMPPSIHPIKLRKLHTLPPSGPPAIVFPASPPVPTTAALPALASSSSAPLRLTTTAPVSTERPLPCQPNPCLNAGVCESADNDASKNEPWALIGSPFHCHCGGPWLGERCEVRNACWDADCAHGRCEAAEEGHGYRCVCEAGWSGPRCDWECPAYLCSQPSVCSIDERGDYGCVCPPGLTGANCSEPEAACKSAPCDNGGTCKDEAEGKFSCDCAPGWNGKRCQRACQDVYSTCDLWRRQDHCLSSQHTDFFNLNCADSCGVCNFSAHTLTTKEPIPPVLEELTAFVGVWQGRGKGDGVRFPLDFHPPSGYDERLSFLVTKPPMFGAPFLNYTSIASSDRGGDTKVTMGFLTIRTRPPVPKKAALMSTTNEGLTTLEEGTFDTNFIKFKPQHVIALPFGPSMDKLDSVEREYRLDGDIMREMVTRRRPDGSSTTTTKYFYRRKKFPVL